MAHSLIGADRRTQLRILAVAVLLITYVPAITTWIPRIAVGGP